MIIHFSSPNGREKSKASRRLGSILTYVTAISAFYNVARKKDGRIFIFYHSNMYGEKGSNNNNCHKLRVSHFWACSTIHYTIQ